MSLDELDDLLDDKEAELEARFQELEQEAEIEKMRQKMANQGASDIPPPEAENRKSPDGQAQDPLADMKRALEEDQPLQRYLLVICPACQAKNRLSLTKVRTLTPICGRCKEDLAFLKKT